MGTLRPYVFASMVLIPAALFGCEAEDPGQDSSPEAESGAPAVGSDGAPARRPTKGEGEAGVEVEVGVDVGVDVEVDGGVQVDADAEVEVEVDADAQLDAGRDATHDAPAEVGVDASAHDAASVPVDATLQDAGPPDTGPPLDCNAKGPDGEPRQLGCTGLYASWPTRTIASTARAYDPSLHLWSDGADKSRWVELPAGSHIDTSNQDEWQFPVGTRFWKEFRLSGRRVETRMLWKKTASQWVRTTYAWSYDQTTATELTTGAKNVFGTSYEIPAQSDCGLCHDGRLDEVLGFELVGLSMPTATGFDIQQLMAGGWLTNPPATLPVIPGNATESAALGWLHANCGIACHNRSHYALAGITGLFMRLEIARMATVAGTDTVKTAVNVPSGFQPSPGAGFKRIAPRDVAHSAITYRDGSRLAGEQMPPLATHAVDTAGVNLVKAWINSM